MKLCTHEEMLNKVLGRKGEPLRDKYENDFNSYLMGETIKNARQSSTTPCLLTATQARSLSSCVWKA